MTGATPPRRASALIERFASVSAWVVGDVMLDEYVQGRVHRVSPEAPVQIVHVDREFDRLGGAANVAHCIAALRAKTALVGRVGDDVAGRRVTDLAARAQIRTEAIVVQRDVPTTRKVRVLSGHQQLLRMDWEDACPVGNEALEAIVAALDALARTAPADVILLSDYAKGVLTAAVVERVVALARAAGVPVVADPKSLDFSLYSGCTVLTPNLRELEAASGRRLVATDDDAVVATARAQMERVSLDAMVVTLGERGMLVVPRDGAVSSIRSTTREVYDVTGAGDAVIALLALGLGVRESLADAAMVANVAAGIVVGKVGTATVSPEELAAALAQPAARKVFSRDALRAAAREWRARGLRIVFTNGCFDLLHAGHVSLLRRALEQGDVLVVGVNSDASVRRLEKGPERPVNHEADRATVIAALGCVDGVVVFDEETPAELIAELRPDVLVKGADYTVERVVGADFVRSYGGRVYLAPIEPGRSTTGIVERLRGGRT